MEPGTLYIVASPLGNLEDITLRALRILREEVQIVYCEDTRQTRRLLNHYSIDLPVRSLHTHSSDIKFSRVTDELRSGYSIAYLTDAGTPGVSDPGSRLVQNCVAQEIPVIPIPGPSALTSLVSVAGFNEKNIIFAGFISKKPGRRINELQKMAEFPGIIVLYESPHRIDKTLDAIAEVFPGKEIAIGREMTKTYEEYIRGTTDDIHNTIKNLTLKGEFTLAIFNNK